MLLIMVLPLVLSVVPKVQNETSYIATGCCKNNSVTTRESKIPKSIKTKGTVSVSITDPIDGSVVKGTIYIRADATSTVGIDRVEFYIENKYLGSDYSSPYSYSLSTTDYPDGTYTITAKAYDNDGDYDSDSITITIDNTQPALSTLSISPDPPRWGEDIVVSVEAYDETSDVNMVYIYYKYSSDSSYTSTQMACSYGYWTYTIPATYYSGDKYVMMYFKIYDEASNTYTTETYKYYFYNPINITIRKPIEDSYLSGKISVSVDYKSIHSISSIEYFVDNYRVSRTTSTSITIYTTDFSDGKHTIRTVIYDTVGYSASDSITVYFDNTPPRIGQVEINPDPPKPGKDIIVSVEAYDEMSNISSVIIRWYYEGYSGGSGPMEFSNGKWIYRIPPKTSFYDYIELRFTVNDTVGNTYTSDLFKYYFSNDIISVSIVEPANNATVSGDIQITVRYDSLHNIRYFWYYIDGALIKETRSSSIEVSTTDFPDGIHKIKVVLNDYYGYSASHEITVIFDNTPPQIGYIDVHPKKPSYYDQITITCLVNDSASSVGPVILYYAYTHSRTSTFSKYIEMAFNGTWVATIPAANSEYTYLCFKIVANNSAGLATESEVYALELSAEETITTQEEVTIPSGLYIVNGISIIMSTCAVILSVISLRSVHPRLTSSLIGNE